MIAPTPGRVCMPRLFAALLLTCLFAAPVLARTLEVGPNKPYKLPSEAIRAAKDGDHVLIAAGEYVDCAIAIANNLTIEGLGQDASAVMTGKTCANKGILVTVGANITVRNLTLSLARAPAHNGAGIRAEGKDLTVERVRFSNNENGILAAPQPDGKLLVRQSEFFRNGSCEGECAHGIYANNWKLVRIEYTRFIATQHAHHIKSRAQRLEVIGCAIEDGPDGTASYEIEEPNGGSLVVRDTAFEKGPMSENRTAVIMIGDEEITQPTQEITIEHNSVRNDGGYLTVLVDNRTTTPAVLKGNELIGAIDALKGPGGVQ